MLFCPLQKCGRSRNFCIGVASLSICNYHVISFVYYCIADGYSAITAVQLRVQPSNRNRPRFSLATYVTYLHVNMSVGEFVVAVATTGARGRHGNRGPMTTFHITAGNVGSVFTIESRTGLAAVFYLLQSGP